MLDLTLAWQMLAMDTKEMFWPILGTVAIVAILAGTLTSVLNVRQREKTRREVAAYVAAGSIDKDTAVAILNAGRTDEDESETACA
jgi:hypothetical protein